MSKKMLLMRILLSTIVILWLVPIAVLGATVDLYPRSQSRWTGSVQIGTGVTILDGSILVGYSAGFPQNYAFRGYAAFDVSGLPSNACVSAIWLNGTCIGEGGATHDLEVRRLLEYPVNENATTLSNNIIAGTKYNWVSEGMRTSGAHTVVLSGLAYGDLEAAAQGSGLRWFAVGLTEMGEDDQTGIWNGWLSGEPVLHVTYTVPVSAAPTVSSDDYSPCINDPFLISWTAVTGATSYDIKVNDGTWGNVGNTNSKTYNVGTAGDHTFYVRGNNTCAAGPASQVTTIQVNPAPAAPTSVWASGGLICADQDYSVFWSWVTGATSYEISEDGGSWVNVGNKNWKIFNHSSAGRHSYSVQALNNCGIGPARNSNNYWVLGGPSGPPVISGDTSPCPDRDLTISWSATANAVQYRLTDSLTGFDVYVGTSTFWRAFHSAGSYEYWIKAYNGCGWSDPDGPLLVTTQPDLGTPAAPVSDHNPAIVDQQYTISWDAVAGATSYELWEDGFVLLYSGTGLETSMTRRIAGDFTYSVKACGNCGCTDLGAELILSVGQQTAVEEIDAPNLPGSYALQQNYPNPFNPETQIEFSLPRSGHVELIVYNVLGENIRTLVNEQLSAGQKTVTWDGSDDSGQQVSSGVYLYKLEAGDFAETRKMMLVK